VSAGSSLSNEPEKRVSQQIGTVIWENKKKGPHQLDQKGRNAAARPVITNCAFVPVYPKAFMSVGTKYVMVPAAVQHDWPKQNNHVLQSRTAMMML
jgi:hypothetical protein